MKTDVETMKTFICTLLFAAMATVMAKESSPMVQVYSSEPGDFGKDNTLICHVTGFHPPEITIELLKNSVEIPGAKQTDLAFEENWHYHLTKNVGFMPQRGEQYACKVTHRGKPTVYTWEPDM